MQCNRDLLNASFSGDFCEISRESSGRLEKNISIEMGKIVSNYKKCRGGRNRELNKKLLYISILRKELVSIQDLRQELEDTKLVIQEWKNKFEKMQHLKN